MIRNLKALGLALVAVFALSAVAASAGSAGEFKFHAEESGKILIGGSQTTPERIHRGWRDGEMQHRRIQRQQQ
jgi:hypothetical protein